MAEDIDGVVRVILHRAVENLHPVAERGAGRAVDDRMPLVEHQVTHVHDVRALERDHRVATRVRAAVELRTHRSSPTSAWTVR